MKKFYFPLLAILSFSAINLACTRSPLSETVSPPAQQSPVTETPQANAFPRQPILLPDRIEPGSEFDQFRSQLRQAVRDRDVEFVKALIPENGLAIGFSAPISKSELSDFNALPGAIVWNALEQAIAIGCESTTADGSYPNVDRNTPIYECPNVQAEFQRQYPTPEDSDGVSYEISRVIVVGENVNVHQEQDSNSPIVGTLSNEVVEFDRAAWERIPEEERVTAIDSLDSWTPVILPNGKSGYVSNRNAYSPLGYRAIFAKVNGNWQLLAMPGGD